MWESIKGFFKRHRRKFLIGGIAVAGVYVASRYAKWRLEEWRANQELEYIAQARKQHHFESNQRTCSITLYSLIPNLRDTLLEKLNTEEITAKLREKPSNKLELWESLKTLSFARTVTAVYSSCLLFVFLRVQLNVIGGYMYLDSLISTEEGGNGKRIHVAEGMQKKYLALVKYLLSEGLEKMIYSIKRSVEDILSEVSLKDKFTQAELQRLVNHIRQSFEFSQQTSSSRKSTQVGATPFSSARPFCHFMVPEDIAVVNAEAVEYNVGGGENQDFLHLVEETLDVLESDDCNTVLQGCLDTAFSHVMTNMAAFFQPEEIDLGAYGGDPVSNSLPLAKIIPIMNGQIYHMFSESDNSYIQDLFKVHFTGEFAANVYEAFSTEVD